MASKRKAGAMASAVSEEPVDPADELMFLCLGGGNEVGRSCHIIQYKGKTVMVCQIQSSLSHGTSPEMIVMLTCLGGFLNSSMPVSILRTMAWPLFPSLTTLI